VKNCMGSVVAAEKAGGFARGTSGRPNLASNPRSGVCRRGLRSSRARGSWRSRPPSPPCSCTCGCLIGETRWTPLKRRGFRSTDWTVVFNGFPVTIAPCASDAPIETMAKRANAARRLLVGCRAALACDIDWDGHTQPTVHPGVDRDKACAGRACRRLPDPGSRAVTPRRRAGTAPMRIPSSARPCASSTIFSPTRGRLRELAHEVGISPSRPRTSHGYSTNASANGR